MAFRAAVHVAKRLAPLGMPGRSVEKTRAVVESLGLPKVPWGWGKGCDSHRTPILYDIIWVCFSWKWPEIQGYPLFTYFRTNSSMKLKSLWNVTAETKPFSLWRDHKTLLWCLVLWQCYGSNGFKWCAQKCDVLTLMPANKIDRSWSLVSNISINFRSVV